MLITPLIILIVIAAYGVFTYNAITTGKNRVKRGWANVITQERQKNKIIPHIEKITQQSADFEKSLQTNIASLRSALGKISSDNIDVDLLKNSQQQFSKLLGGINVAVEAYPNIKASDAFRQLMNEVTEQQENIGASIKIFNLNVEEFNNLIQTFPNLIINNMFNKEQVLKTFTDSTASKGFEYSPNFK